MSQPTATVCRTFLSSGSCRFGDKCRYSHAVNNNTLPYQSIPLPQQQAPAATAAPAPQAGAQQRQKYVPKQSPTNSSSNDNIIRITPLAHQQPQQQQQPAAADVHEPGYVQHVSPPQPAAAAAPAPVAAAGAAGVAGLSADQLALLINNPSVQQALLQALQQGGSAQQSPAAAPAQPHTQPPAHSLNGAAAGNGGMNGGSRSFGGSGGSAYRPPHARSGAGGSRDEGRRFDDRDSRRFDDRDAPRRFDDRDRDYDRNMPHRPVRDVRDGDFNSRGRPSDSADGDREVANPNRFRRDDDHAGQTRVSSNDIRFNGNSSSSAPAKREPPPRDPEAEALLFGEARQGINFSKYENIPVEVSGNDVLPPFESFADVPNLPDVLKLNIALCHYDTPTPIQKNSLPNALAGRDIMACAQTGSGKTAAFLLPLIGTLVEHGRPPAPRQGGRGMYRARYSPCGLVLAPTRELATQIYDESCKWTYRTGIKCVVVYGGQDIREQIRAMDQGCDIVIATPGRLVDFIERGKMTLSQIFYLVFDEADRMLDMGFEPQIRQIVQNSDMATKGRQTLMFSATFPKEIQRLAQDFLHDYVFIAVGRIGSSSENITQKVEYVEDRNKQDVLMHLLPKCQGLTLIFVERKRSADMLEQWLLENGIEANSIHGDKTQPEREHALAMFRCGRCPVLVATDVAARGLDIPNVLDVVNYDMPSAIDDYVHRIGRTGRAGNVGTATTFVNHNNINVCKDLLTILTEAKQAVPNWLVNMVDGGRSGAGFGNARAATMARPASSSGGGGGGGGGGYQQGVKDIRDKGQFNNQQQQQQQQQKGGQGAGKQQQSGGKQNNNANPNAGGMGGGMGGGWMMPKPGARSGGSYNDAW